MPAAVYGPAGLVMLLMAAAPAQSAKRCDWHGPLSGGESQYHKCMDFAALNGKTLDLPKNVTRISADAISICQPKTPVTGAGNADIVFIYDNSGSMTADAAYIHPTTKDTLFYYMTTGNGGNGCADHLIRPIQNLTYPSKNGGNWTIPLLSANTNCLRSVPGDPYNARGSVIKSAIDFLASTSPTSTAATMSFSDALKYQQPPLQLNQAGAAALIKNSITLDTSGGTRYKAPLAQAKEWLTDANLIKTNKQAIIFISDGAPTDEPGGRNGYLSLVDENMPPIYSVYLSEVSTRDTANLKELSDRTGGSFTRVNAKDPAAMETLLKSIISTITKNTMPKGVVVTNKSLSPVQSAKSTAVSVNPDGSAGIALDSIIGLKAGANQIEMKVSREDSADAIYTFTMNVAGNEISSTGGNYSCWDMPTLAVLDKTTGQPVEIYNPNGNSYPMQLIRSPSDLKTTSVQATSANGDKETVSLPTLNSTRIYPSHSGDFNYNPAKANPASGNGVLEVDGKKDLTFVWSHPRDARETVTLILPGRIVPVISGEVVLSIKEPVTRGEFFDPAKIVHKNPVVLTDARGKCILNCAGTEVFHTSPGVPTWDLVIKSPIKYSLRVFDNLGQFVSESKGEMDEAAWAALAKTGDSATINLKILPVSNKGQQLGTGAYLMRAEITAMGDLVTTSSSGESVVVRNSTREYLRRFGYIRR